MDIALFQPDIAGNVGTILRLSACLGARCHIIEPCGFAFGARALKRAGMDYLEAADYLRHPDWSGFARWAAENDRRIMLMTTRGSSALPKAQFESDDILLMGSESAGVPKHVHESASGRIHIPMREGFRSLNVAVAAGIALGEALRQTEQYPDGA
ncbi:MAG: tRNA (cytidine(34)-2'-O)-methyltransferase [Sphingorhabdus sp.]